jgi:hypothetical protein
LVAGGGNLQTRHNKFGYGLETAPGGPSLKEFPSNGEATRVFLMPTRNIHVSIHDVGPAFEGAVDAALALCARFDVRPALLVVPNHHGDHPLTERYADRLRALADRGHEIFLHGYYHRASEHRPREVGRLSRFLRQRVVSGGEAEFADIDAREGAERLQRGLELFQQLRLPVDGFVAPAWSFRPWLLPDLARAGIRFTEDHLRIYDPTTGRRAASLVLNWASRSRGRIASTAVFCELAAPFAPLVPTRVAIHPGDFRIPLLRGAISRTLGRFRGRFVDRAADLFPRTTATPS